MNNENTEHNDRIKSQITHPIQLELFELTTGNERNYSNTIEFWDVIPKFFYGRMNRQRVVDEKSNSEMNVLPSLVRKIKYNPDKLFYNITINPAIIVTQDKNGKNISTYFYPSTREELVEEVLRKLIAVGKGGFVEEDVSVFFSLREIQNDLQRSGHTYSITEIKEALDIMSKTHIEISSERGNIEYKGNILTALMLAKKGRGGTKCFCSLNPLVSKAIKQLRFRKYDYATCIKYQIPLSRYIHKRIAHYYKQMDKETPYIIKLSTLLNDSGYSMHENMTKNEQRIESALQELKTQGTIVNYKIEAIKEKKVKMSTVDYKIYIVPSANFISDIIGANTKENQNKSQAQMLHYRRLESKK